MSLLTIEQVAERLQVSRSLVREYHRHHGLPILRLSHRTVRVREEDLDEWLESRVENGARGASTGPAKATGASPSRFPRMASDVDLTDVLHLVHGGVTQMNRCVECGQDLGESRADKRTCSARCRMALSRRLAKLADEQCAGDPSHQHHSHDDCERCGHLPETKEHFARGERVPTSCWNCADCRKDEEAAQRLWTRKGLASGAIREASWKI